MFEVRDASARADGWVDVALGHRLTIVVAPPGWGKSTLLRALARDDRDVAVTRPPGGWTPFSLARRLLDGLAPHGVSADLLPTHPAPDSPDNPEQTVALAANLCAAAADAVVDELLVSIDDADAAPADPLAGFLEALVLHLPRRLHLVVACRQAPPLRLARLRAAGSITRITAADLALTVDDVGRLGLDGPARETVAEIVRATGGWPLAVRLAAEALRRSGPLDRATLVDRLLAPDAVLFDYLAEEVLGGADRAERELLGLAAHLPYVAPDLLEELDRVELAPLLAPLGETGIFLEPAPHGPGAYRASLLGGEFLRRAEAPPSPELRRAAARVLLGRGELEPALAVAEAVGDPALAADVALAVERPDRLAGPDALAGALRLAGRAGPHPRLAELDGDLQYLRGEWDAALASYARAEALGATTARLARKRAVILYLRGRLDEAEAVAGQAPIDGTDPAEEARVLAWQAAMRWVRGDVESCERLVDAAAGLAEGSGDDGALATVYTTRAMLAALQGDRRANAWWYEQALLHARRAEDVVQIVRILTNRGSHHNEEGGYREAIADLGEAIEMAELIGSETFSALAYANRGEASMHVGRLDEALRDLRRAQAIWERLGSDMVDYALGQLGHVQALRGQRSDALALFHQAMTVAERRGDLQALVPALIGVAHVLRHDDPASALAAAERAITVSQPMWRPGALVAAGWLQLDRGDRLAASAHADEAMRLAHAHSDRPAAAEALLLRAAIAEPPAVAVAEEAGRLWHDLGDPIGEARSLVVVAGTRRGRARTELLERAEAMLADAGAWGHLADARRSMAAAVPAAPVAFTTLGAFRTYRDGQPVDAGEYGSRKARDLMKLLIARRGAPVVRDEAAAMLWPDEPDRSARRLSVLLSTIRAVLDPERAAPPDQYVAADSGAVWLVREHVDVDVELFLREATEGRRLLASGEGDKARAVLSDAAARYAGDFLAEDPYADWAAGLRELARHTFVEVAGRLGQLADERGEHGEAVRQHLRILDVDPYDEAAHLQLIRALTTQRRHGEARRAYRTYCARLRDLDLDPAPFPAA